MTIRKAALTDVPAMFRLIEHYASTEAMLPRSIADLCACLGQFFVAEKSGKIVGCGALKLYNHEVAEIRSLCVAPGIKQRGIGRALTERLLDEGEQLGLRTVFALTLTPEFFLKCGFRQTARQNFPMKVRRDCLGCQRYFHCNEKTMSVDLPARQEAQTEVVAEAAEIPA